MRYIAITPIKDEENLLPKLVSSMKAQTHKPVVWYLVDDGSVDGSTRIITSLAAEIPWCKVLTMPPRGNRLRGQAVVEAFMKAIENSQDFDFEYIAKIDADVFFPATLLSDLIERLNANEKLGICGPELLVFRHGTWKVERQIPKEFVRGPIRIYRRTCFESIGGLIPRKGWDAIDLIKARVRGWHVERYADLNASLNREIGQATGFAKAAIENGKGSYYMGSEFKYMLSEAFEFGKQRPYIVKGLFMIVGYLIGFLKSDRIDDIDVVTFIKNQHRELLKSKSGHP